MEPSDRPDGASDEFGARVATRARDRLAHCGYAELARVQVSYRQGTLMLRGRLTSQYLKQVAQELVCRIEGVSGVVNQIEVRPTADRGPSWAEVRRPPLGFGPTPGDQGRVEPPTEG
jgi:osmotically-inducible protein OsmY